MKPGIYQLTRQEYRDIPAHNQSTLKKWGELGLGKSPAYFAWWRASEPEPPSDAMVLGSALDCYLIDGQEAFDENYVIWEGGTRRGKEWDAFKEKSVDYTILTETQYEQVYGMAREVRAKDEDGIFTNMKKAVLVGELCGELCKAEADLFADQCPIIGDLKVTSDTNIEAFYKKCKDLGYFIQSAFYLDLASVLGQPVKQFRWICVEPEYPHHNCTFYLPIDSPEIDWGRRQYRELLSSYSAQLKSGAWPNNTEPKLLQSKWGVK